MNLHFGLRQFDQPGLVQTPEGISKVREILRLCPSLEPCDLDCAH